MLTKTRLSTTIIALATAFVIGILLLILARQNPAEAYSALLQGAVGSGPRLGETLLNATPLALTGLAVAVSFRAGLFNIGAEGQLLVGALAVAAVAPTLGGLGWVAIPVLIGVGAAGGALWALVPGVLKAWYDANEVITTLMLSYIAFYLSGFVVVDLIKAPGSLPATRLISQSTRLPTIDSLFNALGIGRPGGLTLGRLSLAFPIAVLLCLLTGLFLARTVPGFSLRAFGLNPVAARYAGVSRKKTIVGTMTVSGAIAGVAGALQVLGVTYRVSSEFSPGFGFTGIAVALVGGLSSVGIVLAAVLFAALQTGGQVMQRVAGTPAAVVDVLQGLIVLIVAVQFVTPQLSKRWLGWWHREVPE